MSRIEPPPEEVVERGGDYIRGVAKLDDRLIILVDLERLLALRAARGATRRGGRARERLRRSVTMALNTRSVRSKLLGLLAVIALRGRRPGRHLRPRRLSRSLLREQVVRRGRYIATNLAFNAKYGVLTEDKPLLVQFLDGAVSASGAGRPAPTWWGR